MDKLQSRPVALLLCALMIAAATFGGARVSLDELRDDAERVFYDEGGGFGLQTDIDAVIQESYNISVIASRYLDGNDQVQQMLAARDDLSGAKTAGAKYAAVQTLGAHARGVGELLRDQALSDQDDRLLATCLTNLDYHFSTMSHSGYNDAAAEFNRVRGRFPANILSLLTGVKPLESFS